MAVIKASPNRKRAGRPRKADRGVQWCVMIPGSIAEPWELLLHDPRTGRPKLSLRQMIFTDLLRLLLEALTEGKETLDVSPLLNRLRKEMTSLDQEP